MRATISRPVTAVKPKSISLQVTGSYKLGQSVGHAKFGEGVVLQLEGSGAQERVQINFKQVGVKWLMLAYAKLDVL
jgi:DNA helicase-2/ATP-dependent DNA helicase PcrA